MGFYLPNPQCVHQTRHMRREGGGCCCGLLLTSKPPRPREYKYTNVSFYFPPIVMRPRMEPVLSSAYLPNAMTTELPRRHWCSQEVAHRVRAPPWDTTGYTALNDSGLHLPTHSHFGSGTGPPPPSETNFCLRHCMAVSMVLSKHQVRHMADIIEAFYILK